jgi:molybdopterin molybdotransferase
MASSLLTYPEAASLLAQQAELLARGHPRRTEKLPLLAALGRVLAAPILADRDQPPFDRSTRDGFAMAASSLEQGAWLTVAGSLRAGQPSPVCPLQPGTALEIMTGAPVPPGADAVAMVEHVEQADARIRLLPGRRLRAGDNIVPAGAEARTGDLLVAAGARLSPPHIAVAAAAGAGTVAVYAPPRVAILATGDELVELGAEPLPHQIRNSNSYTLAAQVIRAGGTPHRMPIARDELGHLHTLLTQALDASDLLLLSGGVSAGKYDLVEPALADLGGAFHFTGVHMQPGKPVVFGTLPRPGREPLPFFGLPGNPVSTMLTFLLFAAPLLRALAGESAIAPHFAQACLANPEPAAGALTRFLPAHLESGWDHANVRRIAWQGSGDLAATAQSNCFVVLPPNTAFEAGDSVQVLLS